MCRRRRLDQLRGYPHPIAGPAHAAFKHVADPQVTPDIGDADRAALVDEGGIARDHDQLREAGQRGEDVLGKAVGEIFLLGIAAQIGERQHGDRRLVVQGQGLGRTMRGRLRDGDRRCHRIAKPEHEGLDRAGDVLQAERSEFLEDQAEPVLHMVAHRPRDADATRRTLGLKSLRHIHHLAMQIGAIRNRIADIDADAKADGPIGGMVTIIGGHLLLHLHGTAHRAVDAVEHDEQGVASGLNDPAAMLVDRRVDQSAAESTEPFQRSFVIQPDQAAVTNHIGIDHGHQLSPRWRPSDQVRCLVHRHSGQSHDLMDAACRGTGTAANLPSHRRPERNPSTEHWSRRDMKRSPSFPRASSQWPSVQSSVFSV